MSKHTPGPYHSVRGEAYPAEIYIRHYNRSGQREAIAKILKPFSMDAEEIAANARLFTAAPDLLFALQDLLSWCDENGGVPTVQGEASWEETAARDAIKRATT